MVSIILTNYLSMYFKGRMLLRNMYAKKSETSMSTVNNMSESC